jgi:hypothetical protein
MVAMRNGIVQGEPGIFPWPVGRFFHWISKIAHRDGPAGSEAPPTDAPPPPAPAPADPESALADPESALADPEPGALWNTSTSGGDVQFFQSDRNSPPNAPGPDQPSAPPPA